MFLGCSNHCSNVKKAHAALNVSDLDASCCVCNSLPATESRTSPALWRLKWKQTTWGDAEESLIMCGLVPWHPEVGGQREFLRLRKSRAALLPRVWGHRVRGWKVKHSMGIYVERIEDLKSCEKFESSLLKLDFWKYDHATFCQGRQFGSMSKVYGIVF